MQTRAVQATRFARRLSLGNVRPGVTEHQLKRTLSTALAAAGASTADGDAVVAAHVQSMHRFAFVELRTVEEAANLFLFDGLVVGGGGISIRRPNEYSLVKVRCLSALLCCLPALPRCSS